MDQAENIHKNIYRQLVLSREILRMSKLLEVVQADDSDNESDNKEIQTDKSQAIEQRNALSEDDDQQTSFLDNYIKKYSARKRSSEYYINHTREQKINHAFIYA